jgi:hypothetical protein
MKVRPLPIAGYLLLAACGANSWPVGPNAYAITAVAPFGWFGGTPSADELSKKAAELCPNGYEKLREYHGVLEGKFTRWWIRCPTTHSPQIQNASLPNFG